MNLSSRITAIGIDLMQKRIENMERWYIPSRQFLVIPVMFLMVMATFLMDIVWITVGGIYLTAYLIYMAVCELYLMHCHTRIYQLGLQEELKKLE